MTAGPSTKPETFTVSAHAEPANADLAAGLSSLLLGKMATIQPQSWERCYRPVWMIIGMRTAAVQLTVGTFNVWRAGEPWRYAAERDIVRGAVPGSAAVTMRPAGGVWRRRLPLIADALKQADLDIVGLQELQEECSGDGDRVVETLADRLGMNYAGQPGCRSAVLTPHVVRRWTTAPLSAVAVCEEAKTGYGSAHILHAVVATPGGDANFVVAHWSPRSAPARIEAAQELVDYIGSLPEERLVVVGDLNTVAGETPELTILGEGARPLVDAWAAIHPERPGHTMPSHDPVVRLDYVFLSRDLVPMDVRLLGDAPDSDGFYPSDHLGVIATVARESESSPAPNP